MSAIHVILPGFLTTVQDLGRYGHAHRGISASGAADSLALRAGNLLVGNAENAAALEMTLTGGEFEFEEDAVIALTGSDFGAGLPLWTPVEVKAGGILRCGGTKAGARAYLAVRGGIDAPLTLGSASAHLLTGVGGAALRKGATLRIGDGAIRKPRDAAKNPPQWERASTVRVTDGPQADWFHDEIYQDSLHRGGRVQPDGHPSGRDGHSEPGGRNVDRGRRTGRDPGSAGRTTNRTLRGTPDHRRLSEARQRDFRRFLAAGPNATAG